MNCKTIAKVGVRRGNLAALSLFELLIVLAAIGFLASVGSQVFGGLKQTGQDVKFRSQVQMLNDAVGLYRASGGNLDPSMTGVEVIARLKSVANAESSRKISGLRGHMADVRLRGVMQTAEQAASNEKRAIWSPEHMRFEVFTSGAAGFKRFVLDDSAAEVAQEERSTNLELNPTSGWVWEYADTASTMPLYSPPVTEVADEEGSPEGAGENKMLHLIPPVFSVPGGTYEYANFDLPLSFSNPNPAGVSEIFYSIGGGEWRIYDGSNLMVGPGETVLAYTASIDPEYWIDSEFSEEVYQSSYVITGSTSGLFSNPTGGPDMVTGGWGNYFTWGTPATWEGFTDPSWVLYEGASFVDVAPGEQFLLGSIEYYNGTIAGGTGATGLHFSVELAFAGSTETEVFDYELNLINTPNLPGNTQAESADYVQFGQMYSEIPAVLGGVEYTLIVEFGQTSGGGFSAIDEFFVFEGESATGQLYGTLVPAWGGSGG